MLPALPNRSAAGALLAALVLAPTPAQAEWRDIPYADVAKMPLTLAKVDPQHIFTVSLVAKPGKGQSALPSDFRMQLKVDDRVVPVPIAADGRISLPFRQDWADAGAVLQSNQPKGKVAVSMGANARVPPGTRMSYAQLTEAAPVLERGIREVAGVMSFLAPGVKLIVLRFEKPPQSLSLVLPDGSKRSFKTGAKGVLEMPWQPKWAAGMVELSAPLVGIDQVLK
ncbi:MAG: DUF2987 domain-containing protein [Arenimonas sp.]